jgi:hypothetical protein
MENKCWMCDCELDEDEVQYCVHCAMHLNAEMAGEIDPNKMAEDQTFEEIA